MKILNKIIDYTCSCVSGYDGPTCNNNIDDCFSGACENGGQCIDGVNSYTCDCTGTGFDGSTCQNNINDCLSNPCQNGGTCIDGINGNLFFLFDYFLPYYQNVEKKKKTHSLYMSMCLRI